MKRPLRNGWGLFTISWARTMRIKKQSHTCLHWSPKCSRIWSLLKKIRTMWSWRWLRRTTPINTSSWTKRMKKLINKKTNLDSHSFQDTLNVDLLYWLLRNCWIGIPNKCGQFVNYILLIWSKDRTSFSDNVEYYYWASYSVKLKIISNIYKLRFPQFQHK